jgi:MFS family permease
VANAIAMGLFALASHQRLLVLLFISRILAGATAGNLAACQAAIADISTPDTRARAMGRVGAGIGLGLVMGPFIGGLLAEWGAWLPPLAAAALASLGALGVLFAMPETHPLPARVTTAKSSGRLDAFRASPRRRALLIILALYFLVFLGMTNMQVAFALLAQSRFDWSSKEVGYTFAMFGGLALVIQGGLIGPLSRRVGEVRLLVLGALFFSAGLLGVALAGHPLLLVGSSALIGMGMGLVQPLLSSLASQAANPSHQGVTLGLAQSSGGLARTVGPVASGALYKSLGASTPFTLGAFVVLLAAALGALLTHEGLGKKRA